MRERIKEGTLGLENIVALQQQAAAAAASPAATAAFNRLPRFRVHSQDLFDWTSPLSTVLESLATHAPLSYGSSRLTFSTSDVLDPKQSHVAAWRNSHVITMMFVLNELLQESKSRAMLFLSKLVESMQPGALLLVVDSAGDFSQVSLGKGQEEEEGVKVRRGLMKGNSTAAATAETAATPTGEQGQKEESAAAEDGGDGSLSAEEEESEDKLPASSAAAGSTSSSAAGSSSSSASAPRRRYWVYTLLDSASDLSILVQSNSLWYRYPGQELGLKYPLKFENMRYFVRIYQKKKG